MTRKHRHFHNIGVKEHPNAPYRCSVYNLLSQHLETVQSHRSVSIGLTVRSQLTGR